ncbi:hypothetical protein LENED_011533 [Lentinula edodes]|uniref:Uncharacterized protein n=1 Tax=Lentinula edodes TaxID=5353 RepID=A0A1Q3EQK6_LENED|nr:hypothetical protein LENED_011533 [Lentinula edodes]
MADTSSLFALLFFPFLSFVSSAAYSAKMGHTKRSDNFWATICKHEQTVLDVTSLLSVANEATWKGP